MAKLLEEIQHTVLVAREQYITIDSLFSVGLKIIYLASETHANPVLTTTDHRHTMVQDNEKEPARRAGH